MRIHNIIKTVCLAGSLALLSACEDWLEIEPKDRFGDTTVWGSEENADMFLNDIYNQLPHLNNETQNLGFTQSSRERILSFYDILKKNTITVTMRREFGASVNAACGQLRASYEQQSNKSSC